MSTISCARKVLRGTGRGTKSLYQGVHFLEVSTRGLSFRSGAFSIIVSQGLA